MAVDAPAIAAALDKAETKIADLQTGVAEAETAEERERLQRQISAQVTRVEKLEAEVATNALAALRSEYRDLCRATAKAVVARALIKAQRDAAADKYYRLHGEYCAADAIVQGLQHQVKIGFALRLNPDVRAALAPDFRNARDEYNLQHPALPTG